MEKLRVYCNKHTDMPHSFEKFNNAGTPEEIALKNLLSQNILTQEIKNELNKKYDELKKLQKEMSNMPEFEEPNLLQEALRKNSEEQTQLRKDIENLIQQTKNEKLIKDYTKMINEAAWKQKPLMN